MNMWKAEHAGKTYVEGPVVHEEMVVESRIDAGVLRFKAWQDDGDIVDYELRLEGDRSALLTLLEPPNVKPFRLHRP
jgi:hypothetical protein